MSSEIRIEQQVAAIEVYCGGTIQLKLSGHPSGSVIMNAEHWRRIVPPSFSDLTLQGLVDTRALNSVKLAFILGRSTLLPSPNWREGERPGSMVQEFPLPLLLDSHIMRPVESVNLLSFGIPSTSPAAYSPQVHLRVRVTDGLREALEGLPNHPAAGFVLHRIEWVEGENGEISTE